jgi:hypothetical protein
MDGKTATDLRRSACAADGDVLTLDRAGASVEARNAARERARAAWVKAAEAHRAIGWFGHADECEFRSEVPFLLPVQEGRDA